MMQLTLRHLVVLTILVLLFFAGNGTSQRHISIFRVISLVEGHDMIITGDFSV